MNIEHYKVKRKYLHDDSNKSKKVCRYVNILDIDDLLSLILTYSCLKDVINFSLICKSWLKSMRSVNVYKHIIVPLQFNHLIPQYITHFKANCIVLSIKNVFSKLQHLNVHSLDLTLDLFNQEIKDYRKLLPHLKSLNIECKQLDSKIQLSPINSLTIEKINEHNVVQLLNIGLQRLTINHYDTKIRNIIPSNLFELVSLQHLCLSSQDKFLDFFKIVHRLLNLEKLVLKTPNLNCKEFNLLQQCTSLKEIDLERIVIQDCDLNFIQHCETITIRHCKRLTKNFHLNLKFVKTLKLHMDITSEQLYSITSNKHLKNLYVETMLISHLGLLNRIQLQKLEHAIVKNFFGYLYP
jgi:hypothetical protein